MSHSMRDILDALGNGVDLTPEQAAYAFRELFEGELSPAQAGALPMGLRAKGETPLELAAAARSLSDFIAFDSGLDEKRWAAIDPFIDGLFVRSGPWLYPAYPEAGHGRVFSACLNEGILISPDYGEPSIVPPEFNAGEVSALKSIPRA